MAPDSEDRLETVIPVVEETVRIGTQPIETDRVVIRKTVHQHDEKIESLLHSEELVIERVPIGEVVAEIPATREEGDTVIVPVLEEQLVVEKRLFLKEEVRIRRVAKTQPVQRTVQLRREQVTAEHVTDSKERS